MEELRSNKSKSSPEEELKALSQVLAALQTLSSSSALKVLKMAGAAHNVHLVSNFAVQNAQGKVLPRAPANQGGRNNGPPRPKAVNKTPEMKVLKEDLSKIQVAIRDACKTAPLGVIPPDHELILKKNLALAAIVKAKGSFRDETNPTKSFPQEIPEGKQTSEV